MKNLTTTLIMIFVLYSSYAQTRTIQILIKQQKGSSWSCPSQQTGYKTHQLSSNLSYDKKQKVLDVFKERLKGGDDNVTIKSYSVSMKQNDYLVFYKYTYRYSETTHSECETNIRTVIKGFPISSIEAIGDKLAEKLDKNMRKDDYISHEIIEIKQPFASEEANFLNKFSEYLRKKYPGEKGKSQRAAAMGGRG